MTRFNGFLVSDAELIRRHSLPDGFFMSNRSEVQELHYLRGKGRWFLAFPRLCEIVSVTNYSPH